MHHLIRLVLGFGVLLLMVAFIHIVMVYKLVAWVIIALGVMFISYTLGDIYFG